MIKEIKYGGFTSTPDDYTSPDGDLAGLVNLVPEDNALRPVSQPAAQAEIPDVYKLMCLHHVSNPQDNLILYDPEGGTLYALDKALVDSSETKPMPRAAVEAALEPIHAFSPSTVDKVQPVGNTLVVLASDGVHYILWGDSGYVYLGQKIPELQIQFGLNVELTCWPKDQEGTTTHAERAKMYGFASGSDMTIPFWDDDWAEVMPKDIGSGYSPHWGDSDAWTYSLEGAEGLPTMAGVINRWTNFALGQVNRFINEQGLKRQKFVFPFLVRWAYELYDGSHVMHSEPVLMIPGSKYPFFAMDTNRGFRMKDVRNGNVDYWFEGRAYGTVGTLVAQIINSSSASLLDELFKWKDIVRGIDIYVSEPIYTYDQDGKVYGWTCMDDAGAWDDFFLQGKTSIPTHNEYRQHAFKDIFIAWNTLSGNDRTSRYYVAYDSSHLMPDYILTMPEKKVEDILRSVESPTFHKVASYKLDDYELIRLSVAEQTVKIEEGTLESLAARGTLDDDYHSRDIIAASHAYAYNRRLNLSGIRRTLHAPLSPATAWPKDDSVQRQWSVRVEYKNDGESRVVEAPTGNNGCLLPRYVFYSDRHATAAYLTYTEGGTTHRWRLPMTEHPHLEGAYWFAGLGADINVSEMSMAEELPQESNNPIDEPNKVYTSEVNNPFHFPLLGINTVGTGTILAVCSAAKALSQGQFGAFPLYAFCTDGVWALQVGEDGGYKAIQPVTRDVCVDAESITQLDDSVLFATDRGIMMLSGSQSVCISDEINDKGDTFDVSTLPGMDGIAGDGMEYAPFRDFLQGCRMVYDYIHQRIILYNPMYGYAYVYSLDTKKWGMMESDIVDSINAYPRTLVVTGDGEISDLDEDDGDPLTVIQGLLVTRPLKLDYPDALKTVRKVIQRGYFDYVGRGNGRKPVRQVLYGSRDLFNWFPIKSSEDQYLRGFSGTPYKYFRLALFCDLRKTEKLVGCTVEYEPRFTNQPR